MIFDKSNNLMTMIKAQAVVKTGLIDAPNSDLYKLQTGF